MKWWQIVIFSIITSGIISIANILITLFIEPLFK